MGRKGEYGLKAPRMLGDAMNAAAAAAAGGGADKVIAGTPPAGGESVLCPPGASSERRGDSSWWYGWATSAANRSTALNYHQHFCKLIANFLQFL